MDKISDADLSWLRGHCSAMGLSAYPEMKETWADIVSVIDELRERRKAERDWINLHPPVEVKDGQGE